VRLTRLFVAEALVEGGEILLEPRAGQHVTRVLRMQAGAPLGLFDGAGAEHAATIAAVRGTDVLVRVGARVVATPESPLAITLAQGVSRAERMDYAIQKATELGVARIVPLLCERSVVKLDERQALAKLEHWRGVVISAAEQSGRATVPVVEPPRRFIDHLARATRTDQAGTCHALLLPGAASGIAALPTNLTSIELVIGPEGGLGDEEARLALTHGYRGLRLGPRVLRTETAAAAAIAVLQARYGDLG
jgi:16S rRNA (uracil1498-N3)-methyltransferase